VNREDQAEKIGQLIAHCWSDENFKRQFLADPAGTIKAEGITLQLPTDMELRAVEDTENVFHFVLPAKPSQAELSDEDLWAVAGGDIDAPSACSSCPGRPCGGEGACRPTNCCSSRIPMCAPTPDGNPPQIPSFSGNCQMCSNL
jgi:hypothetical protein